MAWNSQIEQEYDQMLAGPIGDALGYSGPFQGWAKAYIKIYLEDLERGFSYRLNLEPADPTYLHLGEVFSLHSMRVACFLFSERLNIFPWRLQDKSVDDLKPLINWHYQGWRNTGPAANGTTRYEFEGVWDVRPAERMNEATISYLLMSLFGEVPTTEEDFVLHMIQYMRDIGWYHGGRVDLEYPGVESHAASYYGVFDYVDVAEVKRGGCHIASNFMVSYLRSFNIPAHRGREWPGGSQPPNYTDDYWDIPHLHGHCFVHFHSIRWSLTHGDDIYSAILRYIPPGFSLRSEFWMNDVLQSTRYEWVRAFAYSDFFWWCFLLGRHTSTIYDVVDLYNLGMLRDRLENLHIELDLASKEGAPDVITPIFDQPMVNFLMAWVGKRLSN